MEIGNARRAEVYALMHALEKHIGQRNLFDLIDEVALMTAAELGAQRRPLRDLDAEILLALEARVRRMLALIAKGVAQA